MRNYSVWWFVQPSHLILFSLALGTAFIGKRVGRRLVVITVLTYLTISFTPLGEWLARPLEQRFQQPTQWAHEWVGLLYYRHKGYIQ